MPYELVYLGTCVPPIGRPFAGPIDPQFPVGTQFALEVGKRLRIGNAPDSGLRVESMIIARHHAAVTLEADGRLRLEHLGGGGLFVEGKYIQDETRITAGQLFELAGQLVFAFRQL